MSNSESEERTCTLQLRLFQYGGVNNSYDAKEGLRRGFVLSGRVDNPYVGGPDFSDPRFHDKPVRLKISSRPNPEWLEGVRAALGVGDALGAVVVKAGVEPERFELDGEMVELEPVTVILDVNADAFEAIRCQAAEAYDHRRVINATVKLAGESLPPQPDDRGTALGILLSDLDISERREHAVVGFEISDTIYTDHRRGRVLPVERGKDEGYGASISILLAEARYDVSVARGLVESISCEGRVINGRQKPFDGADVTVEFGEHEPKFWGAVLPERAFFGEFYYSPKRPDEEYSCTHFSLNLRCVPEDTRELLVPLFAHEAGTLVILNVNLTIEEEELLRATDRLEGNVRDYSFEVSRRLIKESP